ncbi:hypothetical protein [Thetidibacter halocola]|uniref:Uncharacterized protein n=1 Tax=Thetidibacter halocola TaxID=2827239 RepID=A0A8J8B941_9RHOB|nr:hypothetical protein [Thetidibacter halocola]MBS0125464.1 hypothetical protein [Thetidibacter halocola]
MAQKPPPLFRLFNEIGIINQLASAPFASGPPPRSGLRSTASRRRSRADAVLPLLETLRRFLDRDRDWDL